MKRMLLTALVLALLVVLCACGEKECAHSWKDASCMAPKTCTQCGATEGAVLGHQYAQGACSVCGAEDLRVSFSSAYWSAQFVRPEDYAQGDEGEVLTTITMATDECYYAHKDYYSNAKREEPYYDEVIYDGKTYYDYWFSANMGGIEFTDNGDTVEVKWTNDMTMTLTRSGDSQFTVTATSNEEFLPVGTMFVAG